MLLVAEDIEKASVPPGAFSIIPAASCRFGGSRRQTFQLRGAGHPEIIANHPNLGVGIIVNLVGLVSNRDVPPLDVVADQVLGQADDFSHLANGPWPPLLQHDNTSELMTTDKL